MPTRTGSKKYQEGMALRAQLSATRRKINAALYELDAEIARHFGILSEHDLTDSDDFHRVDDQRK